MIAWRPPEEPNGIITKYTISMDDKPHDHPQVHDYRYFIQIDNDFLSHLDCHVILYIYILTFVATKDEESWGTSDGIWSMPGSRSVVDDSWRAIEDPRFVDEGDSGGRRWVVSGSDTHNLVSNLKKDTRYSFSIRAATLIGDGPNSRRISQTTRPTSPAAIAGFSQQLVSQKK